MEARKPLTHINAGLIIAAALIVFSLIVVMLDKTLDKTLSWFVTLIILVGVPIFVNKYGKDNQYQPTFGNLFAYGFKTTAVFTAIYILYLIILNQVMPELRDQMVNAARLELERQDNLSDDDIDKGIDLMRKSYMVFMIGGILLNFLITGLIGSLIGAGITKKRPHNPLDQLSV